MCDEVLWEYFKSFPFFDFHCFAQSQEKCKYNYNCSQLTQGRWASMFFMDAGVNSPPAPPQNIQRKTQGQTANKEKIRRLNIGSGYWSVSCTEEEATSKFGGQWCHCSPSVSVSWGDQNSRVSWEVREGSPMFPKWFEGSGFPDLCYIHACQGEALLKANDHMQKKRARRKPGVKGWCNVCPQVQNSDKLWTLTSWRRCRFSCLYYPRVYS